MPANTRHATIAEIIKTNELLAQHVKKLDNGLCKYEDNWDDEKIAKEVSSELSSASVKKIRVDMFGKLFHMVKGRSSEELIAVQSAIAKLQSQIATLTDNYNALSELHAKLCEQLQVNKIANVKHLTGRPSLLNGR